MLEVCLIYFSKKLDRWRYLLGDHHRTWLHLLLFDSWGYKTIVIWEESVQHHTGRWFTLPRVQVAVFDKWILPQVWLIPFSWWGGYTFASLCPTMASQHGKVWPKNWKFPTKINHFHEIYGKVILLFETPQYDIFQQRTRPVNWN